MQALEAVGWWMAAVVATAGAAALFYILIIYVAWAAVRARTQTPRPKAFPLVALALEWLGAALVFLLAIPPLFRNMVRLHPGTPNGIPVLCVHGYTQNWGNFVVLAGRLARAGCGPIYAINVTPRFAAMDRCAPQVTTAVERIIKETGAPHVDLVGHSMGGLLARTALARNGAHGLIRRVVTLGTPHHGTLMAHVGPGKNALEMRRQSNFLAGLPPPPPSLTPLID